MKPQKSSRGFLKAGVAGIDITPALGCPMMGYADPARKSERVRDPLRATSLVMESDGHSAVLISVDVIVVDAETVAAIRQGVEQRTGIPGLNVTVHPIQTHSGPCTQDIWGWGQRDDEYVFQTLVPAAIEATAAAWQSRVPVRVGIAAVASDVGVNRRSIAPDGKLRSAVYPRGFHDPFLTVARFESAAGTLANLVHYGAHPTVFGPSTRAISRDWPGIMIDRMERLTKAKTLFIGGATGDVAPRTNSFASTGDETEDALWEAGSSAATDALTAWRQIKDFRDLRMRTRIETIAMPYQPLPSLRLARQQLRAATPTKDKWGPGMCEYKHWDAVVQAHRQPIPKAYQFPMTVTALGPLAVVPVPGEMFAETSLRLRDDSPFQYTLVSSLSGGCLGYFPTRESYVRGGYEPWVAKAFGCRLLAEGIDDVLVQESLRVLNALHPDLLPPLPKR